MSGVRAFFELRWRGILLIAATYFYFLIFAQFGFLHRLSESVGSELWNPVLVAMGLAGLSGALWTGYKYETLDGARWLRIGFVGAGIGALLATIGEYVFVFFLSAVVSGFSLALLTVTLVGVLAQAFPVKQLGLLCGLGTGLAYFLSNVPLIFEASALLQCIFAGVACICGISLSVGQWMDRAKLEQPGATTLHVRKLFGFMLIFLVLIWSDSAAFTRIQSTSELKSISWSGSVNLWLIGSVHLLAAVLGGWLMDRRQSLWVYLAAFAGLMWGLILLEMHHFGILPTLLYASGVSLYSTALVAFAILTPRQGAPVWSAGIVFGISGWLGSAMGIGMAKDLGQVPPLFWGIAGVVLFSGLFLVRRPCMS